MSIGAPPDPFSPTGQNWSLPPPIPHAMPASACAGFRELVAANMRHAGALRIDHVMGLARLFWIPDGATAADGAYVEYPLDALLGVLAQESERARCLVVGEDLGTVPEGFRERLAAADILSYRVLWFERDGTAFVAPARYPVEGGGVRVDARPADDRGLVDRRGHRREAVAGLLGADAAAEAAAPSGRTSKARAGRRARSRRGVVAGDARSTRPRRTTPAIAGAIHRFVGASAAALVLLQADDLAGETSAVNLPGADRERPNWRRKLGVDVEELWRTPGGAQAIADFAPRAPGGDRAAPRVARRFPLRFPSRCPAHVPAARRARLAPQRR